MAFNVYTVITPNNVYLGVTNVVEIHGMGSIVVDVLARGKMNRLHIKISLYVSKLQTNSLLVSNFLGIG